MDVEGHPDDSQTVRFDETMALVAAEENRASNTPTWVDAFSRRRRWGVDIKAK